MKENRNRTGSDFGVFTVEKTPEGFWKASFNEEPYKAFSVVMWAGSRRGFQRYSLDGKVHVIPKEHRRLYSRFLTGHYNN